MDEKFIGGLIFILLVTAVVAIESVTFGRWWKRNEIARRILGVGTVFTLALPFVAVGLIDFRTWLILLFAFGFAFITMYLIHTHEDEWAKQKRATVLREEIEKGAQDTQP